MKISRIIATLGLALVVVSALADNNYKVTSSSRLNVRKSPSTTGQILGTFESGQQIEVLNIDKGWAKVKYKGKTGYVSAKYITELPKPEPRKEEPKKEEMVTVKEEPQQTEVPESNRFRDITSVGEYEVETPLTIGSCLGNNLNLYLTVQGGLGYSNFMWNDGSVNSDMSYSVDIVGQLYFEDKDSFIPQNWYSELALGYDKRGAANFGMNYIHARIYPLGYRIPLSPINIVLKGGVALGFPLGDLEPNSNSWSGDFQCGVGGGFQVEWKQFAIGCNIEYDFTEVSSSCGQTLNNFAVLGTISYKFAKLGHK